jgi:pullulanase/glycogen debranching enzyme
VQPDLLLLDPCNPALRYFNADEASQRAPLPLPTVNLPDGTQAAVASTLAGLAQELARQQQIAAAGPAVAGEAAAESFVPRPDLALEELRLLEVDVRTFAQGKGVQHPGTYLGVAERAAHIRAVGANAVVLTPSYATAKGIGLLSRAALHYMAADPQLATRDRSTSLAAAAEFRQMVAQLHEQGIEVLLQVDLTFTAEGTDAHPSSLSLRGLDYGSYYRTNGVLNCGSAAAQQYILRTLHHWAQEGVDGFCFVNAENMVQDREGVILDAPPLADAICHDPLLKPLKLIAAPGDESLLPRSGVRGFPHWGLWQQRNAGFGRDLMAFLAEDTPGLLTAVAGRLTGSAAVFDSDWDMPGLPGDLAIGRRPAFCINSVTVLGRQSIAELAAEAAELAAAATAAGATNPMARTSSPPSAATISKSLLAMAVLALGVPIIPQDAVADLPSAHFVGVLQRLRQRLAPLLLPPRFDSPRDIRWHSASDAAAEPVWDVEAAAEAGVVPERDGNYIGFSVRGSGGQAVYVGVNPYPHVVSAALPLPPPGRVWERVVDTSLQPPEDALMEGGTPVRARSMPVAAKAVIVLQAAVVETANLQQPTQYLPTQ